MRHCVAFATANVLLLLGTVSLPAQTKPVQPDTISRKPSVHQDAAEKVFTSAGSKVVLLIGRKADEISVLASGVILSADGYIATNYHALRDIDAVEVRYFPNPVESGDYQSFNAVRLLYADSKRDFAILKVKATSLPFLRCSFDNPCAARIGEKVYAIGNPKGLTNTISEGIVSALRSDDGEVWIQHTAPISPGSSGGALVDSTGVLLGMNTWQVKDGQNLNFALSAKHLLAALAEARESKTTLSLPLDSSTPVTGQETQVDSWLNRELLQLQSIVEKVKACPQESKEDSVKTEFVGPPSDVKWDAVVSKTESVRAPYSAYIELVVPVRVVAHDPRIACPNGFTTLIGRGCEPTTKYVVRYLYNLGPTGLQFDKLQQGQLQEGHDIPINQRNVSPLGPPTSCWGKAARW